MRYIVTGGAGFIGSNIVAALEHRGMGPIIIIDDLGHGDKWMNIAKRSLYDVVPPERGFDYLFTDLDPAAIIHMGALTSTTESDCRALVETNVQLTVNLFEFCARRGIPFIWASSAAVYGDKADPGLGEDASPLRPLNAYAWSKLAAEKAIMERVRAGLQPKFWAGLRLFNVYGPNEEHKEQPSFVSKCFEAIRAGEAIQMFRGSDNFARDWVYVEDVAELVTDILGTPIASGLYNVGTGNAVSFADVAAACIEAANKSVPVGFVPFPEQLTFKYQARTRANIAKLTEATHFEFTDLRHGALHYWKTWASHDGLARHL